MWQCRQCYISFQPTARNKSIRATGVVASCRRQRRSLRDSRGCVVKLVTWIENPRREYEAGPSQEDTRHRHCLEEIAAEPASPITQTRRKQGP